MPSTCNAILIERGEGRIRKPDLLLQPRDPALDDGACDPGRLIDADVARHQIWNREMLPLDPAAFTIGFSGNHLADHFGVTAERMVDRPSK